MPAYTRANGRASGVPYSGGTGTVAGGAAGPGAWRSITWSRSTGAGTRGRSRIFKLCAGDATF